MGDVGRRLLDGVPLDTRSVLLAAIAGTALLVILAMREIELILRPESEHRVHRLDGAIAVLCVAVGTIILDRAFAILS